LRNEVKVKKDWKDWEERLKRLIRQIDKIEKIRLKRLRKQYWEERLKGLKKQDWKDWEDKIEERLHQSYQSSSIYINLKNIINQCISASNKNINTWNIMNHNKSV